MKWNEKLWIYKPKTITPLNINIQGFTDCFSRCCLSGNHTFFHHGIATGHDITTCHCGVLWLYHGKILWSTHTPWYNYYYCIRIIMFLHDMKMKIDRMIKKHPRYYTPSSGWTFWLPYCHMCSHAWYIIRQWYVVRIWYFNIIGQRYVIKLWFIITLWYLHQIINITLLYVINMW